MIWMLLYNPDQEAYHIEESKKDLQLPKNGYRILGTFYRYDNALDYYKTLVKIMSD